MSCWSVRGRVQAGPSQSGAPPCRGDRDLGRRQQAGGSGPSRLHQPSLLHNWCWARPGGGGSPAAGGGGGGGLGRPGRTSDLQLDSPQPHYCPQDPHSRMTLGVPVHIFYWPPKSLPLPRQGSGGQDRVTHAASAWPCSGPSPELPAPCTPAPGRATTAVGSTWSCPRRCPSLLLRTTELAPWPPPLRPLPVLPGVACLHACLPSRWGGGWAPRRGCTRQGGHVLRGWEGHTPLATVEGAPRALREVPHVKPCPLCGVATSWQPAGSSGTSYLTHPPSRGHLALTKG